MLKYYGNAAKDVLLTGTHLSLRKINKGGVLLSASKEKVFISL